MSKAEELALLKMRVGYGLMQGGWVPNAIGRPLKSGMVLSDGFIRWEESPQYRRLLRLNKRLDRMTLRQLRALSKKRLYPLDRAEGE